MRFAIADLRLGWAVALAMALAAAAPAYALVSFDAGWTCRRSLTVDWPTERLGGDELAVAEFYTAGHHQSEGRDIRITTEDGRELPCRVLMVGPGDRVLVLFNLARGERRYWAYFGHPQPPQPPKGFDQVPIHYGLLLEMRRWTGVGGGVQSFQQIEQAFDQSKQVIGRTMINRLFLGLNPFGEQQQTISRIEGSLFAPVDGDYTFAASAQQRGALYIDGKPIVFARSGVRDTRFRGSAALKRGRHEIVFYHLNMGGEGAFSVGWQRPDMARFDVIGAESYGAVYKAAAGLLEQKGGALTADFSLEYVGEAFYANHYSHRYRFTAQAAKAPAGSAVRYEWNFGDGQVASGNMVEHVYLADGEYSVQVTARLGAASDSQTIRIAVSRDYPHLDRPQADPIAIQSHIVQAYDGAKLPPQCLASGVLLHLRAGQFDPMLAFANRLALTRDGLDVGLALNALQDATQELLARGRNDAVLKLWESVPANSRLQPQASRQYAQLLLWQTADFATAARVLEPLATSRSAAPDIKRLYAQALVLSQKAEEGRRILEALPISGRADQQAARSGALARTIEYYITEGDWESAELYWEDWQGQFPGDFLEGYSVLLQTRILELRKLPQTAARVAEAFALSVPQSSYAPPLLDRASKLLATIDPARSRSLHDLLRQKYPEDPLSQDASPGNQGR